MERRLDLTGKDISKLKREELWNIQDEVNTYLAIAYTKRIKYEDAPEFSIIYARIQAREIQMDIELVGNVPGSRQQSQKELDEESEALRKRSQAWLKAALDAEQGRFTLMKEQLVKKARGLPEGEFLYDGSLWDEPILESWTLCYLAASLPAA